MVSRGDREETGRTPATAVQDTCKRDLVVLGMNTDTWEAAAADRSTWKQEMHTRVSLAMKGT